jgi:hypothetical protein
MTTIREITAQPISARWGETAAANAWTPANGRAGLDRGKRPNDRRVRGTAIAGMMTTRRMETR